MNSYLQFTLQELLFVVAFAGLGLASLATGGIVGAIVVSLAMVVIMCLAIFAFVGRGLKRAFAIGFLIPGQGSASKSSASEGRGRRGSIPRSREGAKN